MNNDEPDEFLLWKVGGAAVGLLLFGLIVGGVVAFAIWGTRDTVKQTNDVLASSAEPLGDGDLWLMGVIDPYWEEFAMRQVPHNDGDIGVIFTAGDMRGGLHYVFIVFAPGETDLSKVYVYEVRFTHPPLPAEVELVAEVTGHIYIYRGKQDGCWHDSPYANQPDAEPDPCAYKTNEE